MKGGVFVQPVVATMDFINEIFASTFGGGDWSEKVIDSSKYRYPNSGRYARGDA